MTSSIAATICVFRCSTVVGKPRRLRQGPLANHCQFERDWRCSQDIGAHEAAAYAESKRLDSGSALSPVSLRSYTRQNPSDVTRSCRRQAASSRRRPALTDQWAAARQLGCRSISPSNAYSWPIVSTLSAFIALGHRLTSTRRTSEEEAEHTFGAWIPLRRILIECSM